MKREPPSHALFARHLKELGFHFRREFKFCEDRRWKSDFAIIGDNLLIEIEGGIWSAGRHTRGKGFAADAEKYNTATMMGYRVLRFPTQAILNGSAKTFLARWMRGAER